MKILSVTTCWKTWHRTRYQDGSSPWTNCPRTPQARFWRGHWESESIKLEGALLTDWQIVRHEIEKLLDFLQIKPKDRKRQVRDKRLERQIHLAYLQVDSANSFYITKRDFPFLWEISFCYVLYKGKWLKVVRKESMQYVFLLEENKSHKRCLLSASLLPLTSNLSF